MRTKVFYSPPWVFSVEAWLLPAIWAVEVLFPPVEPVEAVFPIAFRGYGGLFLVFLFLLFSLFLFVSGRKAKIKVSRLECGGRSCLSTAVMAFSSTFFLRLFGARSTQPHCFPKDTRPSAAFLNIVRFFCRKHWLRRSSEFDAWSVRARELLYECFWQLIRSNR